MRLYKSQDEQCIIIKVISSERINLTAKYKSDILYNVGVGAG